MTIKAFIFDLDGVITDTAEYHYLAWRKLADSLDIPFDRDDNEKMKGVERMASLDRILAKSDVTFSQQRRQALAAEKNANYLEYINSITPDDILPGVLPLLAELNTLGCRTGVASASKNAALVLNKLGLSSQFDYVADASLIEQAKPHPEVFLNVMETFALRPSECIGIEDAYLGVKAIKSAQMFAVGIGQRDILNNADLVYPDMAGFELEQVLAIAS